MGLAKPLDGRFHLRQRDAVDRPGFSVGDGLGRVGALANRRHGTYVCYIFPVAGFRLYAECYLAHSLGMAAQSAAHDFSGVGQSLPCPATKNAACRRSHPALVALGSVARRMRVLYLGAEPPPEGAGGGARMSERNNKIVFENVSKFYGELLCVKSVNLSLPPGVTSLVGPNGSVKTTLMNLITALGRPKQSTVRLLGLMPLEPERFFR